MTKSLIRSPRAVLSILYWVVGLLVLTGCASNPTPTRVEAVVQTAPIINPAKGVKTAPVVVRVYALSAPSPFDSSDFFSLYESDRQVLGDTLLYREEHQLNPGDEWPLDMRLPANAQYLGAIAAFQEIDQAQWRVLIPIRPKKRTRVTIRIEENRIQAVTE